MKTPIKISLFVTLMTLILISCEKTVNESSDNNIVYRSVNEEYVLIRDVQTLQQSDDEISNHIDSILTGLIDEDFISTRKKYFELDDNMSLDIGFEIIDLNKFNPDGIPETFDSLAARVVPVSVEILDNSTYGYTDALSIDDEISENGNWSKYTCVLGTFSKAGEFQGKGEKYLGIRFSENNAYRYGWIKLYCSHHNDTLRIIDYAYSTISNTPIKAGQID